MMIRAVAKKSSLSSTPPPPPCTPPYQLVEARTDGYHIIKQAYITPPTTSVNRGMAIVVT
jgi:hypothetical protein